MTHEITVRAADSFRGVVLLADCSCGAHIKSDDRPSASLAELYEAARKHMEETFPLRLIEEMNRPARISAKDFGLSNYEFIQALGRRDPS